MTEEEMRQFEEDQRWSSWLWFAVFFYTVVVLAMIGLVTVIGWVVS